MPFHCAIESIGGSCSVRAKARIVDVPPVKPTRLGKLKNLKWLSLNWLNWSAESLDKYVFHCTQNKWSAKLLDRAWNKLKCRIKTNKWAFQVTFRRIIIHLGNIYGMIITDSRKCQSEPLKCHPLVEFKKVKRKI